MYLGIEPPRCGYCSERSVTSSETVLKGRVREKQIEGEQKGRWVQRVSRFTVSSGGRAAELYSTYPRVYRQLNEARLGMQVLPLGHFLWRKIDGISRTGDTREGQRKGMKRRKKRPRGEMWNRSRLGEIKRIQLIGTLGGCVTCNRSYCPASQCAELHMCTPAT